MNENINPADGVQTEEPPRPNPIAHYTGMDNEELMRFLLRLSRLATWDITEKMNEKRRSELARLRISRMADILKALNRQWDREAEQTQRESAYYLISVNTGRKHKAAMIESSQPPPPAEFPDKERYHDIPRPRILHVDRKGDRRHYLTLRQLIYHTADFSTV